MAGQSEFHYVEEIEAQIGGSAEMRGLLQMICSKIKSEAEAIAGREIKDDRPAHGKRYKESFNTLVRQSGSMMMGFVYNESFDAVWVEKGAHSGKAKVPVLGLHVLERALNNTHKSSGGEA